MTSDSPTTEIRKDYRHIKVLLASIAIVLLMSWVSAIPISFHFDWYESLEKPALNPAPWVFRVVWPLLYISMTLAAWLIWNKRESRNQSVQEALALFIFQLAVNYLWTLLFFGLQSPLLGFVWIAFIWFLITMTIIFFARISTKAAWLLLPYWLWVGFANYLSFFIWALNR